MRRFEVKPPDCIIVDIRECRQMINKRTNTCLGYGVMDEPIECCKWCKYQESNVEGDE